MNHPPKLFASVSVDVDPNGIYFDPTKGDAKLKQDNMEIYTKSSSEKSRHWDPKGYYEKWTEDKEETKKNETSKDVKQNLIQKLDNQEKKMETKVENKEHEPELKMQESKSNNNNKRSNKSRKAAKKQEDEENTSLNKIKPQNPNQGTPSNDIVRNTPFNKVSDGDYGSDSTSTQNIYDNKEGYKNLIAHQKRDLNVLKVLKNPDGVSIIDLKSDPSKKSVIKNGDGTTSFN